MWRNADWIVVRRGDTFFKIDPATGALHTYERRSWATDEFIPTDDPDVHDFVATVLGDAEVTAAERRQRIDQLSKRIVR